MSRPTRILQKRFVVFCEGDTEYNYIDRMRKNQGVKLVLKPFNMHGGGYSNFLNKIRKEASSNCLAKFIIVDADRIMSNEGEMDHFRKLYEFCCTQNKTGNTPFFLIANYPDFEYVACLHSPDYKGQDVKKYITDSLGVATVATFKGNSEIYSFLNQGKLSYEVMMKALDGKEKLISNKYEIKKKNFEISVLKTNYNPSMHSRNCSNMEEFFKVIDW
mgnify:FL=1